MASIKRQPTPETISMLNAVINGTAFAAPWEGYVELLVSVREHPLASELAVARAHLYLKKHER